MRTELEYGCYRHGDTRLAEERPDLLRTRSRRTHRAESDAPTSLDYWNARDEWERQGREMQTFLARSRRPRGRYGNGNHNLAVGNQLRTLGTRVDKCAS